MQQGNLEDCQPVTNKWWKRGKVRVCVCVCPHVCVRVCVRTCMCATGQGFAAQKELTPMWLMSSLVEHEGYRATRKGAALGWDRPAFHSEFHHLPVLC